MLKILATANLLFAVYFAFVNNYERGTYHLVLSIALWDRNHELERG